MVETLALIGTGMIGGSIGLACKKAGHVKRIIGYDTNPESLEASKALGICDSIEYKLEDAIKEADLVVFFNACSGDSRRDIAGCKMRKRRSNFHRYWQHQS